MGARWKAFFFPRLTRAFLLRAGVLAVVSACFFYFICIPFSIHGRSMDPTYRDGGVHFCWRPHYWFSAPKAGDVVVVRLAGQRVLLLKRIVATSGQTVEFRNGKLLVNGGERTEPYLVDPYPWNLERRTVRPGNVYLVGDNRRMPQEEHDFGQTPASRILGVPLW